MLVTLLLFLKSHFKRNNNNKKKPINRCFASSHEEDRV